MRLVFPKYSASSSKHDNTSLIRLSYLRQNHVHEPQTMLVTMGTLLSSISIQLLCATIFTIFYIIKIENVTNQLIHRRKDPSEPIISFNWHPVFTKENLVVDRADSGQWLIKVIRHRRIARLSLPHTYEALIGFNNFGVHIYERSSM